MRVRPYAKLTTASSTSDSTTSHASAVALEEQPALPLARTSVAPRRRASTAGAIVMGGDYRGLGVVRSLGRRGIPVWVLTDEHQLGASSRYAQRRVPLPAGTEQETVRFLLDLEEQHGLHGWALFPTADESAALVARNAGILSPHYLLTTPTWEAMRFAYDKRLTYQLAERLGIAHPRTWYPSGSDDVRALACDFPVIVKPAMRAELNPLTVAKAWRADDPGSLIARYEQARSIMPPDCIMIQDVIPGGGEAQLSYAALCQDGQPVAWIMARRTRQYPMEFGRASTYVETIDDPELDRMSRLVLASMRLDGLVEIEYKRDARTGQLNLLDVNARVWGWHSIGRRAGVDFPYLLWRLKWGDAIPPARARSGVRWVRGSTDFPTALNEMIHLRLPLSDYLRSLRGPIEHAIMAWDDPMPAIVEVPLIAHLIWKRGSI